MYNFRHVEHTKNKTESRIDLKNTSQYFPYNRIQKSMLREG